MTLAEKLANVSWPFVIIVVLLAVVGYGMLYSAAGGEHSPWAWRHAMRFAVGAGAMLVVALIDIRLWFRYALLIYVVALIALIGVEIMGEIGKGAQRWIDLGVIQLQPSEIMKIGLVLALARLFHAAYLEDVRSPFSLVLPALLIIMPALLVLRQPDLGTTVMLVAGGGVLFFLAGVPLWLFALVIGAVGAALPVAWEQLHDYQKQRVLTFLDPENDPLGSGYHIIQSKIALGSGGTWGKGFVQGTQSQLNFLPEKHTDFIFTMLAEEAGFFGAVLVLILCMVIVVYGIFIALRARAQFGRLLACGISVTFFLYVVINVAMVTGAIPVVGVPLPLVSYGGTAMLTVLVGFGLLLCVDVHRDVYIPRFPVDLPN
ncbi:MAG: rod shape-determining protein RodA [Geminicoccaceae bacterium]